MNTAYLDDNMILDMAGGDKEAFRKIYEATKSTVFGLALSILKNRQDAEDVMHDAYIKIYTGAPSYRPCGKPVSWMISIVRNLCLNRLRDESRTADLPEDHPEEADPEDLIEQSTAKMVLDAAMNVLDDDERQIVMLHAVTGYRHREIADLLGLPQGTVLSKYNRALKKMRTELNGKEDVK